MWQSRWSWAAVGLVILAVGGAAWLFQESGLAIQNDMRVAVFTTLLQLGGIVIIGFFVQKGIEQSIETAGARAQLRKELLMRLLDASRTVKEVRRTLRAASLTTAYGNRPPDVLLADQLQAYKEQMAIINKVQPALETLPDEYSPIVEKGSVIERSLHEMEQYLAQLHKEWELQDERHIRFEDLERVKEFTARRSDRSPAPPGRTQESFWQARKAAVEQLVGRR
jgi:hypothetical protein